MKENLLVLDDEVLILTSLENLFEDDFEVFTASDAESALGLAQAHDMAVILCDERMPGVSGHEFLRRVREVSNAVRVMISGYADLNAVTEAVNQGQIFAYIAKPWDPLALKATIKSAVDQFKLLQEVDRERELLRALMENIPDSIYFKDCQSRFLRVNHAYARALGVKDSAECIGKTDADYFESENAQRWRLSEEEIVRSGWAEADRIEHLRTPDGGLRWMSTTKVPMFDRAGQVTGIAGISRDLTELKFTEEMLREQNERSRMIIETANDAFVGMNPDGTITAWNPRAEAIFGWTAVEMLGLVFCDHVIPPADRASHAHGVEHFLAFEQASHPNQVRSNHVIELTALHRDGHEFPVEATVWRTRVAGAFGFNAFLRDISDRRRSEEALQHAKEAAESANRAKSEFLTTMSHEMRTPMNAILGMADILAETPLGEEQRDYVRIFQRAGASLLNLINDVLDISKVESGQVELESIDFDLGLLLRNIVEMMAPRARDRRLQLTLEVEPALPLALVGDSNRLRQILLNLVGNALKFTEQGSVVVCVKPDGARDSGWVRFNVVDTGIGIPADKTEMIFHRFTQADSSLTRKFGGAGLGLAISTGLADLMGGRIGCSSEIGKGSTFFLLAPFGVQLQRNAPARPEPPAITFPSAATGPQPPVFRILIVEDCEDNLAVVRAYLKGGAFQLDFAGNGQVAVEKVKAAPPHLVLMDLQMPVMGGLEATRAIREWEAETNQYPVPILALTAHATQEGAAKSLAAGCNEHLTKPIDKPTLLEAISRNLSGKIRVTPPKGIEGLVPKYLSNVRRDLRQILEAADAKDCTTARHIGHQFKGTGIGYGFPEITRTGAALERAALAGDEVGIRNQILALSAYLDRVEVVA